MGMEGGRKEGVKTLPGMVTLPRLHRAVRHGAHSYEFRLSFLTNKLLEIKQLEPLHVKWLRDKQSKLTPCAALTATATAITQILHNKTNILLIFFFFFCLSLFTAR